VAPVPQAVGATADSSPASSDPLQMPAAAAPVLGGGAGYANRAVAATCSVLLVAWVNQSAAGGLFLCAFLYAGAWCISIPYAATSYRHHRRVWTVTATAALLLFVLQLLAQLLYGLHLLPSAADAADAGTGSKVAAAVLEVLGLGSMEQLSVGYILLVSMQCDGAWVPPVFTHTSANPCLCAGCVLTTAACGCLVLPADAGSATLLPAGCDSGSSRGAAGCQRPASNAATAGCAACCSPTRAGCLNTADRPACSSRQRYLAQRHRAAQQGRQCHCC
jgi:hypothetical protein